MFDPVFLIDPSLKSTFVQNKSCRSSLPLQLLFWPNFTLPYKIWSFNQSKLSQNRSKRSPCFSCDALCPYRRPCCDRRDTAGDSTRRVSRRTLSSALRRSYPCAQPYPFPLPSSPNSSSREQSRAELSPLAAPAIPVAPAPISSCPDLPSLALHLLHPSPSLIEPYAGRIGPAIAGRH